MQYIINSGYYRLTIAAAIYLLFTISPLPAHPISYSFGNPLVDAAQSGDNNQAAQLLEQGMPVDSRGKLGATALMRATYHGNLHLMTLLLARGANPDTQDIGGATALHMAVRQGHTEAVRILLEAAANPNLQDFTSLTPFDYAINLHRTAELYLMRNVVKEQAENNTKESEQATPTQESLITTYTEQGQAAEAQEATIPAPSTSNTIAPTQDTQYIGNDMPWLANQTSTTAPQGPNVLAPSIPLKKKSKPALDQRHGLKHLHKQSSVIAAAPVQEVQEEYVIPPKPSKHKRAIRVHEAIRLPDNYDANKIAKLNAKRLRAVPMLRAEIFGGNADEAVAYAHLLASHHHDKRFHNVADAKGVHIYATPFANSIEAESWCNHIRDFTSKWNCKVVIPN